MAEPILEFRFSKPTHFHCSFCSDKPSEGAFHIAGEVEELIAAFKVHVEQYHPKGADFNEIAARIRRETESK